MPVAAALPEGFKDGKLSLLQGGGGEGGGWRGRVSASMAETIDIMWWTAVRFENALPASLP